MSCDFRNTSWICLGHHKGDIVLLYGKRGQRQTRKCTPRCQNLEGHPEDDEYNGGRPEVHCGDNVHVRVLRIPHPRLLPMVDLPICLCFRTVFTNGRVFTYGRVVRGLITTFSKLVCIRVVPIFCTPCRCINVISNSKLSDTAPHIKVIIALHNV